MTQARSTTDISLVLTPMQVPDAVPNGSELAQGLAGSHPRDLRAPSLPNLVIYPGEPSELVIQVHNQSREPLQLQYQVQGDFPADWCQFRAEGSEARPGQTLEGVLYFTLPADYLEQAYTAEQLPLRLDYRGRLTVLSLNPASGGRTLEHRDFQVVVRPRSLYLDFLPDLYREIDFVGRFLQVFEQTFEPTVNALDSLWAYLDPLTAPQSLLPFLTHWVGWNFDAPLDPRRQRFLIRHALQIYRWRGTRRGLRFYLHLATGLPLDDHLSHESAKHIGIHETFSQGLILGEASLGENASLGGGQPFHFAIHLRPDPHHTIDTALVHQIITQEKPAFCTYDLIVEPPP